MKRLLYILMASVFVFTACDETEAPYFGPIDDVNSGIKRGAWVRADFERAYFDFSDLENASMIVVLSDPSGEVSQWDLSVSWVNINTGVATDTLSIRSVGEFPSTVEITAQEIVQLFDSTLSNYRGGDQLNFVATITAKDGTLTKVWPPDEANLSTDLFGNPGQKQALSFSVSVACPVPNNLFIGEYTYVPENNGAFGVPPFGSSEYSVTIEQGINFFDREIDLYYLADFGIGQPRMEFQIRFICGDVFVVGNQGTNLGCSSTITVGPDPTTTITYDENDDSEILITITDAEADGGCGVSPTPTSFRLVKVE